jgi:ATP-binding cassette subfamily C protein
LLKLFSNKEKILLVFFVFINVSNSFLEIVGITTVIPVVAIIAKPEIFQSNQYFKAFYEFINPSSREVLLMYIAVFLIFFFILKNIYGFLSFSAPQFFFNKKYQQLVNSTLAYYLNKPYTFFFHNSSSELLRNIQSIQNVTNGIFTPIQNFVSEAISVVLLWSIIAFILPAKTILIGFAIVITALISFKLFKQKAMSNGARRFRVSEQLINNVVQGIGSIKETIIYGNQQYIVNKNAIITKKLGFTFVIDSLLGNISRYYIEAFIATSVMLILLVMLQTAKQLDDIILELSFLGIIAVRMMPSISRIGTTITTIRSNIPSLNHIYYDIVEALNATLKTKPSPPDHREINFKNEIEIKNVSFAYRPGKQILNNVSLKIAKNQCVGFVGASGAGKTTLIDTIIGLLPPDTGKILVDGQNIRGNMRGWQSKIAYIPQNIYIFDATIRQNIALGIDENDINEEKLEQAIKMAQLKTLIEKSQNGIFTRVGESGIKLSGGERQRLGIARALYHDPEVLVLDEATAALDNATEDGFIKAINAIANTKTIIIIAHRLSTLKHCDIVYSVEHSNVCPVSINN